jgi:hypothetical protein
MTRRTGAVNWMELWGLLGILTAIILLWDTPAVYPLQVLVVFFHEMSHGIAAILTGGSIQQINVEPEQGGFCITAGGSRFIILSAGYLGSLVWGGVILVIASRTRLDRAVAAVIGALLLVASVLFVRPFAGFGVAFGVLSGVVLIAAAARLPNAANDFALKVIGLTSCLYAVLDIKSDVLDQPGVPSDAHMLADYTKIPTIVWGLSWICIAVVAAVWFLFLACRRGSSSNNSDFPNSFQGGIRS